MKKLRNQPENLVEETLQGYALAHKDRIVLVEGTHIITRRDSPKKVKFLMGNGAGHEPAVIGWVGPGMFDANVVGEVFTAPSSDKILEAIEFLHQDGSPVLLAVQNHAGDVLNANMAYAEAVMKGIPVKKVLFYDDIATAPKGMEPERRGIGGMLFYTKIVGAFLEQGGGIDEAVELFERVRDHTRTFSVGFTRCTHPATGLDIMALPEGEIEMGVGTHGEGSGSNRIPMPTSKELAKRVSDMLIEDLPYQPGDEILLFVNGLGSTTCMELSIYYKDLCDYLESRGIAVYAGCCDECLTTQELGGVSVSFCKVDETCKKLWDAPCKSSLLTK